MKIHYPWAVLLQYSVFERAAGWYFCRKLKSRCFIMKQNQVWTVVTVNRC